MNTNKCERLFINYDVFSLIIVFTGIINGKYLIQHIINSIIKIDTLTSSITTNISYLFINKKLPQLHFCEIFINRCYNTLIEQTKIVFMSDLFITNNDSVNYPLHHIVGLDGNLSYQSSKSTIMVNLIII